MEKWGGGGGGGGVGGDDVARCYDPVKYPIITLLVYFLVPHFVFSSPLFFQNYRCVELKVFELTGFEAIHLTLSRL